MVLEKILNKGKEKLVLEIPMSIIMVNNSTGQIPAIQLKKVISDPENIGYFIKNCLKEDSIDVKIIFKDKFKAKVRLSELGFKIEN